MKLWKGIQCFFNSSVLFRKLWIKTNPILSIIEQFHYSKCLIHIVLQAIRLSESAVQKHSEKIHFEKIFDNFAS